ncbi:MAG TPA: LptF/LptG family permease [Kiritimatiellia bacterium]|nr:LptF/LptG family permease [Kiritimatiellia bacterium]
MKLIDKYLLRTLLAPLAYCFIAFTFVYIIYDLFDNMSDFVDGKTPLLLVFRYYLTLIPSVLTRIVPISILLAVLYSLSSLTKNNELTAMRASGVSLTRLMVPFMAVGLLISIGVAIIHETVAPDAAYWCHKFVREQTRDDETVHVAHHIAMINDAADRTWFINRFDTRDFSMEGIEYIQRREDNTEAAKVSARSAKWMDGYWIFTDMVTQNYDREGNPRGAPVFTPVREMSDLNEQPSDIMGIIKEPEFMSSRELLRYIRVNTQFPPETVNKYLVDLHFRLSQPWTCLIVTLLGIPFGSQTGRKGAMVGISLSIGLFFSYYALINFGLFLGKEGRLDPWVAGWLPNLIFLIVGLVMIRRMR